MHISELLLVLLVALLVFKPEDLPKVLHTLGKGLKWLRTMMQKLQQEILDGQCND